MTKLKSLKIINPIMQRWARVTGFAFPRSRYFRNASANFIQERGTQKNRNAKFAFLLRDDTVMTCTERRGGRGGLWTRFEFDPKPASRQYTRTPRTRDEGG